MFAVRLRFPGLIRRRNPHHVNTQVRWRLHQHGVVVFALTLLSLILVALLLRLCWWQ